MRRRAPRADSSTRVDDLGGVRIEVVPVGAAPMVTLEDPRAGAEPARGAFARLRPTEDLSPEETQRWADSVRKVARAVRVLPAPRSAAVPVAFVRGEDVHRGIREEAIALAEESGDPELLALVKTILEGCR